MTSKLHLPVHAAIALAVTGSMALATPAWAQQVHKAEVARAADIAAQVKAGEAVYQTVCLACPAATLRSQVGVHDSGVAGFRWAARG